MKDLPRRRRLEYNDRPPSGGGMPIVPLVIVVILLGLLLGGVLHHFLGNGGAVTVPTPFPSVTPIAQTTPPPTSPTPLSTQTPRPKRSAKPSPKATVTATPSASPVIILTPVPSPSLQPTPAPSAPSAAPPPTQTPHAAVTLAPAAESTPMPKVPTSGDAGASAVVRAYLGALQRGDESTAASYLTKGLPTEKFMTASAHVNSVDAAKNADGSYTVTADVTTPSGEYFSTFTVEPGPFGMQIGDHYTIKPH